MNLVIVGAGNVGRAPAAGWKRAGHAVALAVRDPGRGDAQGAKREGFLLVPARDAAQRGDVIVLAVPWDSVPGAIAGLGPLEGKIVVDATNPLTPDSSWRSATRIPPPRPSHGSPGARASSRLSTRPARPTWPIRTIRAGS